MQKPTLQDRLCYPASMVEDIIGRACRQFLMVAGIAKHDFEIGGDKVYFGTGGAAVRTLDLDTHTYRAATLQDLSDFTRLADTLGKVSWFARCCVATDVEDITDLDINTAYALLKGTTQPVGTSFTVASSVGPIIHFIGNNGKALASITCSLQIVVLISPMYPVTEVTRRCCIDRLY